MNKIEGVHVALQGAPVDRVPDSGLLATLREVSSPITAPGGLFSITTLRRPPFSRELDKSQLSAIYRSN